MAVGKRSSTSDPLTEHDVADRLDKAGLRVLRIMMDVRQIPGAQEAVKSSRYLTNVLNALAWELQEWGFTPQELRPLERPLKDSTASDAQCAVLTQSDD